jgi:hypothetical protein
MLKHFTFDFVLQPVGPGSTRLLHSSYFEPQNLIARLMAAMLLRPKFRSIRQRVLRNIKELAERGPESCDSQLFFNQRRLR